MKHKRQMKQQRTNSVPIIENSQTAKMTIGVPMVTCLHRVHVRHPRPPNTQSHEKSRFSTNISLYLGINARQSRSYYERRIRNRSQALAWYQFE